MWTGNKNPTQKLGEAVVDNTRTGRTASGANVKRYNLALPEELFEQIQGVAEKQHTSVLDVLRRFIKLGLLAAKLQEDPNAALILRQGGSDREIVLL